MPAIPRLALYGMVSTALAGAVVGGALSARPNFYAAAVSVGHSGGSLMVLANFGLFLGVIVGVSFKALFFGDLRPVEYEHMFERLWIFLTESLLALTIFKDDFSVSFMALYSMLVFLKCFHWISADRVDYIDQVPPPGPPPLFHIRLGAVLALLTTFDILLFLYAMEHVMFMGVSAMVLFASEFAILIAAIAGTWARYAVGVADLRRANGRADAPPWEEKSMYLFYIDLAVDFAKLLTYLVFFIVIFLNYGLPVHILRDVYMTLRSFLARGADLVRYRRATRNMDSLYPDATAAELDRLGDHTCIICREEMVARENAPPSQEGPNETPKKLACGHIFHFHCLRSWLERQQICPTCRRDVLAPNRPPPPTPAQANNNPLPNAANGQPPPQNQHDHVGTGQQRDPAAEEAERDRMRSAFEDYFRLPGVNGDAPPIVPPQRERNGSAPPVSAPQEEELQRGIWGAPIVPGRFAPPPLGAAPSWPEVAPGPSYLRPAHRGHAASGTVTPATSQAPVVFSSAGSIGSARGTSPEGPSPIPAEQEQPIEEDDDDVPAMSAGNAREAAAAAALRRLGGGLGGTRAGTSGRGEERSSGSGEDKGKGRSHPDPNDFDAPVTHRITLTPHTLPPAHSGITRSPEAARVVLNERLRALREVDHVVWGLVGELSRLRSAWEAEDAGVGASGLSPDTGLRPDEGPGSSAVEAAAFGGSSRTDRGDAGPSQSQHMSDGSDPSHSSPGRSPSSPPPPLFSSLRSE